MTNSTNARGDITDYQYDAMGRMVKTTDALGNYSRNIYDANGNLTEQYYNRNHTYTAWQNRCIGKNAEENQEKMKNRLKQVSALLLAVVLCAGLVAVPAAAKGLTPELSSTDQLHTAVAAAFDAELYRAAPGSEMCSLLALAPDFTPHPSTAYASGFITLCEGQQWFINEIERLLNIHQKTLDLIRVC